ncbi:MAG: LexA family transcriptional regulator [Peptococcaceae bacterium]|nr:LexA family transcriptional regulator [Peptococcaceae bacterium]
MSVKDNIKRRREALGMTLSDLARSIGLKSRSAISKIELGENDIGQAKLLAIANALHTTPAELLGAPAPDAAEGGYRLPVLGSIAGGTPIEAVQNMASDDWVDVSAATARDGRHIALRVSGHSMEPMIYDGSIAIIRLCPEWVGGAVMAVYVGDYDATLKKVKIDSHGILMLQPFNPDFETKIFTPEEQQRQNVKPLGILVEHRKRWV